MNKKRNNKIKYKKNFLNNNKKIISYQDETPLFTGFLFGSHKLQTLMIGSIFLLDIVSFEREEKAKNGVKFGKNQNIKNSNLK